MWGLGFGVWGLGCGEGTAPAIVGASLNPKNWNSKSLPEKVFGKGLKPCTLKENQTYSFSTAPPQ